MGDVGDAVLEPLDRDAMRIVGSVLDLGERLEPVDALAVLAPKGVRVLDRARIHVAVLLVVDEGALAPRNGDLVDLVRHCISSTGARAFFSGDAHRHFLAVHYATAGGPPTRLIPPPISAMV